MRADFIVVHLREPCSFCRTYISDATRCAPGPVAVSDVLCWVQCAHHIPCVHRTSIVAEVSRVRLFGAVLESGHGRAAHA